MKTIPTGSGSETSAADLKHCDEAGLIEMLDKVEQKHGFIPRDISDEVARLLEVKLERLRRIQGKLDSTICG